MKIQVISTRIAILVTGLLAKEAYALDMEEVNPVFQVSHVLVLVKMSVAYVLKRLLRSYCKSNLQYTLSSEPSTQLHLESR